MDLGTLTRPGGLPAIHSISLSFWDPVYSVTEHVNPFTDLIHITKGRLRLHVGGSVYAGEAGDSLIVPRGQRHRDEFPADPVFDALVQWALSCRAPMRHESFTCARMAEYQIICCRTWVNPPRWASAGQS